MSNVRIPHLEDLIFEGTGGFAVILDMLDNVFNNGLTGVNLTRKWDGAPAIICGQHPQTNQFFVSTKSFWNINSKVNYTVEDIKRNHPDSPGLQSKLFKCLTYLPELNIKGILQGDMMYEHKDLYRKDDHICFKPNIIEYKFHACSPIAKRIHESKIGIVFHTSYGPMMEANYNVDIGKLNLLSKNVWFRDASTYLSNHTFSTEDRNYIGSTMNAIHANLQCVRTSVVNWFQVNETLKTLTKQYINDIVRKGKQNYIGAPSLHNFITAKVSDSISEAVKQETKANRRMKLEAIHDFFFKNEEDIQLMCDAYNLTLEAKKFIMSKLDTGVVHEGFVVSTPGYAVKLVDRATFSYENFNSGKDWK